MSALVETLATALALSGLAALCLAVLPQAPPRLKFAIAVAGLAAWLVPWSSLRDALPAATLELPLIAAAAHAPQPIEARLDAGTLLAVTLAAATLIGLALFTRDCLALRLCVRRWRATSRPADHLRALLPPELAALRAEIRVVAHSNVAAASGYLEPTIWIGDRYAGEPLRLMVVHEMWHVRSRDPVWLALLAAVRRTYWWNPLVAHLARQATLMLESICDHRSAAALGKVRYRSELASLVLAGAAPAPRLMATVHTANLDVQRVRLLGATLRLRARDVVVMAAFGVGAAAASLTSVAAPEATHRARSSVPTASATPTSANASDAELLDDLLSSYAYTPQQNLGNSDAAR
ncbi:MAG TPA: M56 family metallopeptidase [Gammaproteobacteria bacterium]|nr:M56 family metallopeptidase [Gammaproteobacteria bacterium]